MNPEEIFAIAIKQVENDFPWTWVGMYGDALRSISPSPDFGFLAGKLHEYALALGLDDASAAREYLQTFLNNWLKVWAK